MDSLRTLAERRVQLAQRCRAQRAASITGLRAYRSLLRAVYALFRAPG